MAINEQSDNLPLADVLRAAYEWVAASVGRAKDKARIEKQTRAASRRIQKEARGEQTNTTEKTKAAEGGQTVIEFG